MNADDPDGGNSIPEVEIGAMQLDSDEGHEGREGHEGGEGDELVPAPLPGLAMQLLKQAPALEETCFLCKYAPKGVGGERIAALFREAQFARDPTHVFRDIQTLFVQFAASPAGKEQLPVEDRHWSLQCIQQHAQTHAYADSVDRHLLEAVIMCEDILRVYSTSMGLKRKRDEEAVTVDPEAVKLTMLTLEKKLKYVMLLESRKKARRKAAEG